MKNNIRMLKMLSSLCETILVHAYCQNLNSLTWFHSVLSNAE